MTIEANIVRVGDRVKVRQGALSSEWGTVVLAGANLVVEFGEDDRWIFSWDSPQFEILEHEPRCREVVITLPSPIEFETTYPTLFHEKGIRLRRAEGGVVALGVTQGVAQGSFNNHDYTSRQIAAAVARQLALDILAIVGVSDD